VATIPFASPAGGFLGQGAPGSRLVALHVAVIAVVAAGAVVLQDGGDAFWLCLPAVLLACAWSRSRFGAALSSEAVIVSAAAALTWMQLRPPRSPLLALLVLTASVAVLIAVRERLGREGDALRNFAISDPLTGIDGAHARDGRSHSRTLVGLDVHAVQTHAAVVDPATGEARVTRLRMAPDEVVGFLVGLGPGVLAVYEAGSTGFALARAARARRGCAGRGARVDPEGLW
jgi:hypothetical protein